jgi:hypothetical protein
MNTLTFQVSLPARPTIMFHIPSFLLGLVAFPALFLAVLVVLRFVESVTSGRRREVTARPAASSLDPLRFTPRLISQLRRPLDGEHDHARAS